jgi:hypothetical protein
MPKRTDTQAAAEEGRQLVARVLRSAGAKVDSFRSGRLQLFRVSPSDSNKQYVVRVKTRRSGTWQVSTTAVESNRDQSPGVDCWIFVDRSTNPVSYYVAPDEWVRRDIALDHERFLNRHGGKRPQSADSTHHAIQLDRIAQWASRWDLIGLTGLRSAGPGGI